MAKKPKLTRPKNEPEIEGRTSKPEPESKAPIDAPAPEPAAPEPAAPEPAAPEPGAPEAPEPEPSQAEGAVKPPMTADARFLVVATETLAGDVRDYILEKLKFEKSTLPWNLRPEKEQREVVERVSDFSRQLIARAVEMISAGGRPTMTGHLRRVVVKDALQAQIDFSKQDDLRHDLLDSVGENVLLVFVTAERFLGARGAVKVTPDQLPLGLEEPDKEEFGGTDLDETKDEGGVTQPESAGDGADETEIQPPAPAPDGEAPGDAEHDDGKPEADDENEDDPGPKPPTLF